jgi:hypothetical protein
MQKSKLMMLIASSILIAGILVAGCTDSTSSVGTSSTLSPIPSLARAAETTPAADTGGLSSSGTSGEKPQFNASAGPMGTPPDGMQMNSTRPSGTPPEGMQMNGTRPSGTPPGGIQVDGTLPSGTPPSGAPSS